MDDSTDVVSCSTEQITNCSLCSLLYLSSQFENNVCVINTSENKSKANFLKQLKRYGKRYLDESSTRMTSTLSCCYEWKKRGVVQSNLLDMPVVS
jgi:hypothetical protein